MKRHGYPIDSLTQPFKKQRLDEKMGESLEEKIELEEKLCCRTKERVLQCLEAHVDDMLNQKLSEERILTFLETRLEQITSHLERYIERTFVLNSRHLK
jgi:hypothetical protein